MWLASLRDLQWRRRRVAVGILCTAIVLGVTLLMGGVGASLRAELNRTMDATGADAWVVSAGVSGPLTGIRFLPASDAAPVAHLPGVRQASPVLLLPDAVKRAGSSHASDVVVVGYQPGGLGAPPVATGHAVRRPGQAVVDGALGIPVGGMFQLGSRQFQVVGLTSGLTIEGGIPLVYLDLHSVQTVELSGLPVAQAILTKGVPTAGLGRLRLMLMTPTVVIEDVLRRLHGVVQALTLVKELLWVVAAGVVGGIVYLSALERTRDQAVLKATGASTSALFADLLVQALVIALAAGVLSIGLAWLMLPLFLVPLILSPGALLAAPFVALAMAVVAAVACLRRTARVDPALAFG